MWVSKQTPGAKEAVNPAHCSHLCFSAASVGSQRKSDTSSLLKVCNVHFASCSTNMQDTCKPLRLHKTGWHHDPLSASLNMKHTAALTALASSRMIGSGVCGSHVTNSNSNLCLWTSCPLWTWDCVAICSRTAASCLWPPPSYTSVNTWTLL